MKQQQLSRAFKRMIVSAIVAALAGLPISISAAPSLMFDSSGILDGIKDLTVGTNTFDVVWQSNVSYYATYASNPPALLDNPTMAAGVQSAIYSAISDAPALTDGLSWWNNPTDNCLVSSCNVWIPTKFYDNGFGMVAEGVGVAISYDDVNGLWTANNSKWGALPDYGFPNYAYAVLAVPEPETYAMLMAGLGLMGFVARRRKQAQV